MLWQSQEMFWALIESVPEAILITDKAGRIIMMNAKLGQIFGYDQDELLGQPVEILLPVHLREHHIEHRADYLRHPYARSMGENLDLIGRRKDGDEFPIEVGLGFIKAQESGFTLAFIRDITRRKRAEDSLRESEQRYRRRAAELQALYETSLRLNAQLEISELLSLIVEQVLPLVRAEAGSLYTYDPLRERLICAVGLGYFRGRVGRTLKPGQNLAGRVFQYCRPLKQIGHQTCLEHPDSCNDETYIREVLAVPLLGAKGVLGVLDLGGTKGQTFDEYDEWLTELFAAQAAVALENAGLHTQTQRQAKELTVINQASRAMTSTLDLSTVLHQTIRQIKILFDAQGASVLLRDGDKDELFFAAVESLAPQTLLGLRLPLTAGIAGWVARHRRPVLTDNAQTDPRFCNKIDRISGMTTYSLIAVPLLFKDRVIGVVEVINKAQGTFEQRDLELLASLTSSATIAIENARLHEAEREQFYRLQQSQAQLIQVEKMAALGRLVASIAHEINNPLQSVQTCLALAEEALEEDSRPEKLSRYLQVAGDEIERIAAIIHRMRDFYRSTTDQAPIPSAADTINDFYRSTYEELQSVNLCATLESVLQLARKRFRHHQIEVECTCADDIPPIQGNPDHLKQVFFNLTLNAIDAMAKEGGHLRIHMAPTQIEPEQKTGLGPGNEPQPAVRIEFEDTGIGMSPEILSRLFEYFFTTKEAGSGLGLSISYQIIQAHNGRIYVASQIGQGAKFTILLPLKQPGGLQVA
jgi:PAS domain S-box-containing protein